MEKDYKTKTLIKTLITAPILSAVILTFIPFVQPVSSRTFVNSSQVTYTQKEHTLPSPIVAVKEIEITKFNISIPKIGLYHEIKPYVDPRYTYEYLPVLDSYVAHGKFTNLPSTSNGRTYLFAHSRAVPLNQTPKGGYFSHIDLLTLDDQIVLEFNEETYIYKITDRKIVDPSYTEVYTAFSDKPEIALQTCYPPGSTDKRLIVFAKLVENH